MDVLFFLKERTRLIRQYYVHAASPFNEIIRKIEAEEEPYVPPYVSARRTHLDAPDGQSSAALTSSVMLPSS